MSVHRMDPVDAAWLHMARPTNRVIVNSVMWFDEPVDWDAYRQVLAERLIARYPRFTQRVVEVPAFAWWEDAAAFDLEAHLHHRVLPAPGGRADLEDFVSGLLHRQLPLERPLWEMYLIDGYRGRGSAILARIHHCIADGIALSRVMLSLTDDPTAAADADIAAPAPHAGAVAAGLGRLTHLGGDLAGDLRHPSRIPRQVAEGVYAARAFATLVGLPPDADTSLRGHAEIGKRVLWSDPMPLADIHTFARHAHATVTEVVLAALSGALRSYLARADGAAPDVRAMLPVNLRPLDEPLPAELGNRFGLAYVSLPVSVDDRAERLAETRRRTAELRNSAQGTVSFQVLDLVGRTPYAMEQSVVDIFGNKATAVVTSVPGPHRPVFLAGRRVRGMIAWPPEAGNLGLGVSIISYDGDLTIGILADERLVSAPAELLAGITAELDELLDTDAAPLGQGGHPGVGPFGPVLGSASGRPWNRRPHGDRTGGTGQ